MNAKQFYEMAMQPGFPNAMVFDLTATDPNPEHTFSQEGCDAITEQMGRFMVARIVGTAEETNRAPRRMQLTLSIAFDDEIDSEPLTEGDLPFYQFESVDEFETVDGLRRLGLPLDSTG